MNKHKAITGRDMYQAAVIAGVGSLVAAMGFVTYEPMVLSAIESQFTTSVSVTSEIAFRTAATNITLPSIPGLTGGTSTGGTQVNVLTNNALGYTMTLKASSSPAMQGNSQGGSIQNYVSSVAGTPDFAFNAPANSSRFGFTVEASTTSDLDQSFRDNGSTCGAGAGDVADSCWLEASTSAKTIVNRSTRTDASGATTTVKFRLTITSNPSPIVPQDTYTATTTLTATLN